MQLDIITPEQELFSGEVQEIVSAPGSDGSLGILNTHAPLIATLQSR